MSKQNPFNVGDAVSYSVGSDRYAGTVTKVSPARVSVRGSYGDEKVFTLRADGEFRRMGRGYGRLVLGGEDYLDPSF